MYRPNLQSVALPVTEIIAIAVLGWVANLQSWGRGGRRWYRSKDRWRVPIGPPQKLFIYLYAFQRYCPFCAPVHHFSPPYSRLPKFLHCPRSPGSRWMAFGLYDQRRCWANCPIGPITTKSTSVQLCDSGSPASDWIGLS